MNEYSYSSEILNFSKSKQWLYLLQYKTSLVGEVYGRIEKNSGFYLSKNGYNNPYKELQKSIETFRDPSEYIKKTKQHPQCLFPARYSLLKEKFNLKSQDVHCPVLEKWKNKFEANKLNVVFASAFVSNPASIMGHTFLKFVNNRKPDYLNMTIGYAANMPKDVGAFDYIYKGLFGGFEGVMNEEYFFRKIYEYNNIEDRDLWEFELDMSKKNIRFLVEILWELSKNAKIDYFFIDENCSYIILAILQAVFPKKNLLDGYPLYVLPHETVKSINSEKLIRKIKFVPSKRKELFSHYKKLNKNDQKRLLTVKNEKDFNFRENESAEFLDGLLSYIDFKQYKNEGFLSKKEKMLKNKILLKRSMAKIGQNIKVKEPDSPLMATGSFFLDLGAGRDGKNDYYHLNFRPGIHKKNDRSAGFIHNSTLSFLETSLQFKNKKLYLEKITFAEVESNTPFFKLDPKLSWGTRIELNRDYECAKCKNFAVDSKLGINLNLGMGLSAGLSYLLGFQYNRFDKLKAVNGLSSNLLFDSNMVSLLVGVDFEIDLLDTNRGWRNKKKAELRLHNLIENISFSLSYTGLSILKAKRNFEDYKASLILNF